MHFGHLKDGETFLMGVGATGHFEYASGLYRAVGDLDLEALQAEFATRSWKPYDRPDEPVLFGDDEAYDEYRNEAMFQEWLLEKGHVERLPCKLVTLESSLTPEPDGNEMKRVVESVVFEPRQEATVSTPSPR